MPRIFIVLTMLLGTLGCVHPAPHATRRATQEIAITKGEPEVPSWIEQASK